MDKDFERLLEEAKKIANKRKLSEYASCGHVGCALMTDKGNIYTGVSIDMNCALGKCAEYGAISDMIKNGESRITKIVAYAAKQKVYSPCGSCRELIRMVNMENLDTEVLTDDGKIYKIRDLLPEMYITKEDEKIKD